MKPSASLRNLARDFLALGSWVFYILVIARALIEPYRPFVDQLVIAAVALIVLEKTIKNLDAYLARGLVLVVFTNLFYKDIIFSLFTIAVWLGLLITSYMLGNPIKKISLGIFAGILSTTVAFLATKGNLWQ